MNQHYNITIEYMGNGEFCEQKKNCLMAHSHDSLNTEITSCSSWVKRKKKKHFEKHETGGLHLEPMKMLFCAHRTMMVK